MTTSGPCPSPVMILGEAPGEYEEKDPEHRPFAGPSGHLLDQMLLESGFSRNDCFCGNVCDVRPPGNKIESFFLNKTQAKKMGGSLVLGRYPNEHIRAGLVSLDGKLRSCQPKLVIALGGTALWALTGKQGILKWRGSEINGQGYSIVPTVHPASILRQYSLRAIAVHDLRRAKRVLEEGIRKPEWNFQVRPSFQEVIDFLRRTTEHRLSGQEIAVDIETRGGQIACVGIALSKLEAMCIPFMCIHRREGYWSENEELAIILALREVLQWSESPEGIRAPIIFQNGAYDLQYFAKQWGFTPACTDDTMLMQHVLFPGLSKGLGFLSSMYCDYHYYWKDDGREWNPKTDNEEQLWRYNCEDCVRTLEIYRVLRGLISSMFREAQYSFQMRIFRVALQMMLRGIRVDRGAQKELKEHLTALHESREAWLKKVLGRDFNCRSHPQMTGLFYDEMGIKPVFNKTPQGYKPTCDDEALDKLKHREPLLKPLIECIQEIRSIGVFQSNYAEMRISPDSRARSSINLAGTETYRFSMSEDAFGFGGNLQTIPKGTEDK